MELLRKNMGWILVLFVIGFVVYAFNFHNPLFWDDNDWIVNNPFVHDFSHTSEIFTKNILAGFGLNSNYYRPFLLLTFAFNYAISGIKPLTYHLLSNAFHIGNAILIFLILLFAFKRKIPAFLASLLFLVHPLQVEAVAYISGRGDLMSVFFMLLGLWLFIKAQLLPKKTLLIIYSMASMVLAILSRETSVLLPFFIIIFYVSFLSAEKFWKSVKKGIYKVIPYLGISLIYGILRLTVFNFQNTLNFYKATDAYSTHLFYRIYTFGHVLVEYFKLIFVPIHLHMERDLPVSTSLFRWPTLLGLAIMLGVVWVAVVLYKKSFHSKNKQNRQIENGKSMANEKRKMENISHFQIWFFGWGWFFIGLSMVSGIVPINAIIYEHWLYLPLVGFCALAGYYLWRLFEYLKLNYKSLFIVFVSLFAIYILFYCWQTIQRNIIWGKPEQFYEDILKYSPDNIRILNNLANLYSDEGKNDDAAKIYQTIIDNKNNIYAQPYYNLGNIYRDKGDLTTAVSLYKEAIQKDPTFPFSYQNLAVIYAGQGNLMGAAEMLEDYKKLKPEDPGVYYNLARVYQGMGNTAQAKSNLEEGLKYTNPGDQWNQAMNQLLNTIK